MNQATLLNRFKEGLGDLLEKIDHALAKPNRDPYAEVDAERRPHEHDTRLLFVDELLCQLGWTRGAGGNVLEEARLQGATTKFMDYVGVVDIAGKPLLLVEAKAWDKPFVSARAGGAFASEADLIVAAIQHVRDGKSEDTSPAIAEWHRYLRQVEGYVRTLKEQYGHDLPRAMIVSGEWLVVFKQPTKTFLVTQVRDDIAVYRRREFTARAGELFNLLHRSLLTQDAPIPLRPAQLRQFLVLADVAGAFRGVHVHYDHKGGSSLFTPRPRISIYPAVFVVRHDDVIYTVMDNNTPVTLDYEHDNVDGESLAPHLHAIDTCSNALLAACVRELGGGLPSQPLGRFPGFPSDTMTRTFVGDLTEANHWFVATGNSSHFLLAEPRVTDCRFHTWAHCGANAIGQSAISVRTVVPRAFFIDSQRHHCAHQVVQDRRTTKCLIAPIDSRICCQVCAFLDHCWTPAEKGDLPCGQ
ncbi:hypothetical protein HLH33_15470 [Gluconacetobacter diazotrophicus]|uniref:Uncharacterized protein n=1 Tax=Gluconacetobacter diazotrophicus TaxID=33996 RepID=A0A7W4NLZ1_GLUDI|nr:hypothetical protein [Gluconacetobacter diazotrophicus]MBB2157693.1 hypothetical protein [Gluconacetobacter diazotrophicus]